MKLLNLSSASESKRNAVPLFDASVQVCWHAGAVSTKPARDAYLRSDSELRQKSSVKSSKRTKELLFLSKTKKTYIRPTHEELGTWLTSHPVDNLLRRPLCYRLHGFLDTKLPRTKMCLVIADVILQIEMMKKKKSVTLSHSRNKSVLFVCVFTRWTNVCTRGTGGWNEIPTTAPHRPAWDQRCIHELPGRLGKITTLKQNKNLVHLKMPFPASYADK